MTKVTFTFKNIQKIEKFAKVTLRSYFHYGTPNAKFKYENGEELDLKEGDQIFKDRSGNIFKKIN